MDSLKKIVLGVVHGFWDSVKGVALVFYIDVEIHKQKAEREAERQARLEQQQRWLKRSESPTPSSASAMIRDDDDDQLAQKATTTQKRINSDERSVESLQWSIIKSSSKPRISIPFREKRIANQVLKCCALNGGFTLLSIVFFEQLVLPALRFVVLLFYGGQTSDDMMLVWGWMHSILSLLFKVVWVLPIFLLCKVVNSLWFADIANEAFKVRKGRPHLIPGISRLVADFFFSLIIQILFLAQSMLVGLMPFGCIGNILCFLHLSLLYSLYSFEYKWFNMGWELHRRLSYIELNWPYFFGFGIPLTVLTNMTNSLIISSCIFSIFFPLFILSGNEAKPVVGTIEKPLPLFTPVIFISNLIFSGNGERKRYPRRSISVKKTTNTMSPPFAGMRVRNPEQWQLVENLTRRSSPSGERRRRSGHRYPQPPSGISPSLSRTMRLDYSSASGLDEESSSSSSLHSQLSQGR